MVEICFSVVVMPSIPFSSVLLVLMTTELTEFVLQLDEEVEAMQATILYMERQQQEQLQQQQHKHSKNGSTRDNSNATSKGGKDRTKSTPNGPIESASTSTASGT